MFWKYPIPNIDMIKVFPLDYIHLICLGVVNKVIVSLWVERKPGTKLSSHQVSIISKNLLNYACKIPVEFNRKTWSLAAVKRWKATEFRMFLLYLSPVVMIWVRTEEKFVNFHTLHVAIALRSSKKILITLTMLDLCWKFQEKLFDSPSLLIQFLLQQYYPPEEKDRLRLLLLDKDMVV